MKAITVKVKPEDYGTLHQKIRTAQELGFNDIDLAVSVKTDVATIVREIQAAGSRVQSLRLCTPPDVAMDLRQPAYSRISSPVEEVRRASVAMVISICESLSRTGVSTVVFDGGSIETPRSAELWTSLEAGLEAGNDVSALVKEAGELRAKYISTSLEALCRSVFELLRSCDGLRLAVLTPNSPFGVCLPDDLGHLLSDAPPSSFGYWHSTSAARCLEKLGVVNEEAWLDRFGPRMFGVYLSDAVGAQGEQAPGLGEVNFKRIKPYLATNMARVLTIDDDSSGSKLRFGADFLCEVGIF